MLNSPKDNFSGKDKDNVSSANSPASSPSASQDFKGSNFRFLREYDLQLLRLGALAEHYFKSDPNTCLLKLRQFGELLAQLIAAKSGMYIGPAETQVELIRRLNLANLLPPEIANLFHLLRLAGNKANHAGADDYAEALTGLRIARNLAIWFHRTFGSDASFTPGPFLPPPDPVAAGAELQKELISLRQALDENRSAAEKAQLAAQQSEQQRLSAEEIARREREERQIWEQLASEAEQAKAALAAQLAASSVSQFSSQQTARLIKRAEQAAALLDMDETTTRALIDQQLRQAGWEADSKLLRYSAGTRPAKGRNLAIAEWPVGFGANAGRADYALFTGLECVAMVEAKRQRTNVSAAIDQVERYAKAFVLPADPPGISNPGWGAYSVPFVFATNGRPYLKQIETQSGIWFRDVRKSANLRRALNNWLTPDGLKELLKMDTAAAQVALAAQPIEFNFPLRHYQKKAIEMVESKLAGNSRSLLIAMATGTGKTKLAIAMLYRLLAAKRFRRICFVVDRSILGNQTEAEFSTTRLVSAKTFADIFGLKGLDEVKPASDTRVHICTIQGLVKRVLYSDDPPPVDQYDLIVVDECHRGYLLDRELSDTELNFRSEEDYISKYRRVLEHFDATKIGLTATPALHTVEIFGNPVFKYSYREAVIDGFLVDHEPPIQITTALAQAGINFRQGEQLELLNPGSGQVDLTQAADDLRFEVEAFNKKVITIPFNRVVAEELTQHIDPNLPGKTLVFAVSDAHADIVVDQLKQAFSQTYGAIEDGAIRKITGSVDRVQELIRSFRNDALPKIAVTVDLLTTGVDVPAIDNLVFLRRVNSRILYDQMLGRATRLCPEINKEVFRIFDAVDLYSRLEAVTEMKPVAVNPKISFEQLFEEMNRAKDSQQLEQIRAEILVKLRRKLPRLNEDLAFQEEYAQLAGESLEATLNRFASAPVAELTDWLKVVPQLGQVLDLKIVDPASLLIPISHHEDSVLGVTRGYGSGQPPEDFLDSFTAFVRDNLNQIAALTVVVQRPRELSRAQLKALRLELDSLGYSETNLKRAWTDTRHEEIAASIIGFVRQAALGDVLIPYEQRVTSALRRILARRSWTTPQQQWLRKLAERVKHEIVADPLILDENPFDSAGGFERLNRIFEGQLNTLIADLNEEIWKEVA